MTVARSRTTPIVGPLLVVGAAYLFFFAGGYFGIFDVYVRVSSLVIVGVVLALYLVAAWRSPSWYPASRLWPALAIGIGVLAIGTVFSRNPRISLDFLAYGILLAALYLLLRGTLAHPGLRERLCAAVVILAFAIDIAYLAVVVAHWRDYWQVLGRFALPPLRPFQEGLTYGNPGLVAALAVLASVSATAHLGFAGPRARVAVIVLWVLTTAVVIVSGTRGAWLALAITAVVALVMLLAAGRSRSGLAAGLRTTPGRLALGALVVVVVVGVVVVGPTMVDRVVLSGDGGRISYWTAALRMFADAPLTGVGPGMWAPQRILHTAEGELDYYIPHAHNLYLQTAAESGVLGLVAGLVVLVLVGRLVWLAFRDGDPVARRWAVAAVLAAVYFGAHQVFDVFVNMPAALFVFAFPIAWLDANGPPTTPEEAGTDGSATGELGQPRVRRALLGAGALVVVAAVAWGLASERSALKLDAAKAALDAGDASSAAALAAEAVTLDPSIPPNQLVLALAAIREGRADVAGPALEAVVGADGLPAAWIDLAWLDAGAGDGNGARAALAEGLRLGRQQPATTLAAGAMLERLGDVATSDQWYATAISQLPRLAADPYWHGPERAARWAGIEAAAAAALSPEGRVDMYLSAEDLDRARAAVGDVADPATATMLGLVVDAWGGDAGARATLDAQAHASPRDVPLLTWSARLADRFGDPHEADVFRFLADMQTLEGGTGGTEVDIVTDVRPPRANAGTTWGPYGIYTYRRPTPGALLLPGMPQIVWAQD